LRVPLIVLILVLVSVWEVDHWLPEVYAVIIGGYAVAAVVWLVVVLRGPMPRWVEWASTAVDVLVLVALCAVSGGATAALLPVFFLLPISVAFQDRPWMTAIIGTVTAAGYLAVWIFYSKRDDKVGLPNMVYTHFGFLLWLAVAVTALCYVLARRSARVRALQEMRRQLVSEAMQSDERHNREVAEHLHDGPLQTLLAARLELDEARERNPDPALDMVYAALQETASGLRSTVTQLHPQVLAQLGLTPAVRELLRQFESRNEVSVEADLEDVGKPESQALLYRAARELLTNIGKHAKASFVRVGLRRQGDRVVLTIDDDGTGFDPAIVAQYVADGHIGLGSLLARFDAMGGAMEIDSRPGDGTQVTVTSPPEPLLPREQT
jgi:two-component system NarL family sensor kinase